MVTRAQDRAEIAALINSCKSLPEYIEKFTRRDNQYPILAFPREPDGFGDYEYFTAADIGLLARQAISYHQKQCVESAIAGRPQVVAMLGPADVAWVATFFGLSLLGHSIVLISPSQPPLAIETLLAQSRADFLYFDVSLQSKVDEVCARRKINAAKLASRRQIETQTIPSDAGASSLDNATEKADVGFTWHSSGSTGTPKLFPMKQESIMARIVDWERSPFKHHKYFVTSSPYNSAGSTFLVSALSDTQPTYFYNDRLPYTEAGLTTALNEAKATVCTIIPYALEQLAASSFGIDALKHSVSVNSFGSVLPTQVGDRLVAAGVALNIGYAMSETGVLMSSAMRGPKDRDWEYMAILPTCKSHILMWPIGGDDLHECIVLSGLPGCPHSNSHDPPGSFHTRDVFVKHPAGLDRWKIVGRLDDMINMAFPLTVLALPYENKVKQHPLVEEAVMFGNGRPRLGLLVFYGPDANATGFIERIWSTVECANAELSAKARISRDMVIAAPAAEVPRTDKQNFIRPRLYQKYAAAIDAKYTLRG